MQAAASGRERGAGIDWLTAFALAVAALAAVPILAVGVNIFAGGTGETRAHLADTVLPEYVANTLKLTAGVSVGVIFGGVATAWLTVMHDFPGRRIFQWALILPLAMPAYVMAYAYTDLLQFVGPVQAWLRESFGWQNGVINEVCDIVGHHHHPRAEETINFKILYDADLIVNLEEKHKESPVAQQKLVEIISKSFLTNSGKQIAQKVFLVLMADSYGGAPR